MLLVRKNLTEILLEVTNDLIFDMSKETVSKLKKGSCKNQKRNQFLFNSNNYFFFSICKEQKKTMRIKYFCSFSFLLI